jgi:hypothetical protein
MTTLIGTPSNLIVSGFRAGTGAGGFAMFDFTPVEGIQRGQTLHFALAPHLQRGTIRHTAR